MRECDWLCVFTCDWQSVQMELANHKLAMLAMAEAMQSIVDDSGGSGCRGCSGVKVKYSEIEQTLTDVEKTTNNKLNSLLQQLRLVYHIV